MRNYPAFPRATPHQWAGSPRVPHPSATGTPEGTPFDLHALGTPPALILSQDQTLHQKLPLRSENHQRTLTFISAARVRFLRAPSPVQAPSENESHPGRTRRSSIFGRPTALPPQKGARTGNQPVKVRRFLQFASKRKPPCEGRATLSLERSRVSAPIVTDDLQSDTLRSLLALDSARASIC
jgi:hypothetical protein